MFLGHKRRIIAAALAVTCLTTTTYGAISFPRVQFTRLPRIVFFRPVTPPIRDVAFDDLSVNDAAIRAFVFVGNNPVLNVAACLDDTTVDAAVAGEVLTIQTFTLENTDEGITIDVTIDPATLKRNTFNSTFSATGTATYNDGPITLEIPIVVRGTISIFLDTYVLRGTARGFDYDNTGGTTTYSLLRFDLEGAADIPPAP